jgi:hypothetical protein
MATLHSGYEFDALQSHNARRPSTYVEPAQDTVEELRKTAATTNPSFSPIQEDIQDQSTYTTSNSTPRQASIYESNIELDAINPQHDTDNATEPEFSLPPVDGGKDAWLFLFSAFILEVLVWGTHFPPFPPNHPHSRDLHIPGFPFAYGIFQEYYTSHPPFAGSRNIAIIGTCAMGLMYLSAPLVFGLLAWYPNSRRPCIMIGLLTMCLSLGLSSLSRTVPHLIVTQGVFYAVGGAMCYSPAISFMDEWFVKRKGLAFGIMWVCCSPSRVQALKPDM